MNKEQLELIIDNLYKIENIIIKNNIEELNQLIKEVKKSKRGY